MNYLTLNTALETACTFQKEYKDALAIRGAVVGGMNRLQRSKREEIRKSVFVVVLCII